MKRKILHIAEPFATGVLSFLVDITRRQIEEYDVYILWGQRPLTPEHVETLFDPRITLIKCDAFKGALGSVVNLKVYFEVRRVFNQIKPDIVHMHSSASGFIGRWSLPLENVKSFYTPHGYSFLMQGGLPVKRWLFFMMEWLTALRPTLTVACSEGEYKEALKLPGKKTYVNNGIKTEGMEAFVDFAGKKPLVVTSGRTLKQKNPSFFNEIAKLLPNVQFIWIGSGDLDYLLSAQNVEITGWIEREKALEYIKNAGFFILTSLWEGLPLSLLEGMYLKKVCLATNVIGNRDAITDGVNGFICETPEDFAVVIRECLDGKHDMRKIAENAHEDVVKKYNVNTMATEYNKLYNE